ncbi:hypothetical protein FA15DRAFT_496147 [Coprinopsis marcescibilis]|uniref:Uncharacterized protein n=1 Tax=Coprinopsis marcescibilis TaxID=230819 RepID=A0A5C3KR83_COPMA|nr:hypothetical protein FA15DRAFT_496147 [Coprinopsis marcescibilis]
MDRVEAQRFRQSISPQPKVGQTSETVVKDFGVVNDVKQMIATARKEDSTARVLSTSPPTYGTFILKPVQTPMFLRPPAAPTPLSDRLSASIPALTRSRQPITPHQLPAQSGNAYDGDSSSAESLLPMFDDSYGSDGRVDMDTPGSSQPTKSPLDFLHHRQSSKLVFYTEVEPSCSTGDCPSLPRIIDPLRSSDYSDVFKPSSDSREASVISDSGGSAQDKKETHGMTAILVS